MVTDSKLGCEVVIAGGGMVGLTLGIALAQAGVETVVIDGADPAQVLDAGFDGRVSSIAPASRRMLEVLSLWADIAPQAEPVLDIVVSDGTVREGASAALLPFEHSDAGEDPLAHMVENRHVRLAQEQRARGLPDLRVLAPARVTGVAPSTGGIAVTTDRGQVVEARLCVAADGRESHVRAACGIKTTGWPYRQHGIVTTVAHERPHRGVAHEIFLASGPFAILPMTGHRSSIVWTERELEAAAFMTLAPAAFADEVRLRFGDHLGAISLVGPRWSYPLGLQLANSYVAPRVALVGDAAHTIHPLAGQGVNLGFMDAAELIGEIRRLHQQGKDIGQHLYLRRYERSRKHSAALMLAGMQGFRELVAGHHPAKKLLRDVGLKLADTLPGVKPLLLKQAMGLNDLPGWIR